VTGERWASAGAWLRRRAENVAALLLGLMFAAFVVQILFRYLFNFPVGWTSELTIIAWLWLVLMGSAFVLTERQEIRVDLVYGAVGRRGRIVLAAVFSIAVIVLYVASFKASLSYVAFMKVEKSSYLRIPMSWVYSIYIAFLVAIVARYAWLLVSVLRGNDPQEPDPTQVSSGL